MAAVARAAARAVAVRPESHAGAQNYVCHIDSRINNNNIYIYIYIYI
jgi:hypothetical protein